jgi:two-component system cell cycle sensor histidine kinase/response regulator CckA
LQEPVREIRKAAERAAGLTRHLLAFSRKQILQVESLHLTQVIRDLEPMLRRLLPENIQVEWMFTAPDDVVSGDKSQIEQVVLNLVINARDAMPGGGRLVIETAAANLDTNYVASRPGSKSGPHVMLAVYLPSASHSPVSPPAGEAIADTGSERILLVEDDAAIRGLCAVVLRRRGYTVDEAPHGEQAMALAARADFRIDLLITDVVLPGVNGRVVAERIGQMQPSLKVLYISGYTENAIVHTGVLDPQVAFLAKPFTPATLLERVRLVLDALTPE